MTRARSAVAVALGGLLAGAMACAGGDLDDDDLGGAMPGTPSLPTGAAGSGSGSGAAGSGSGSGAAGSGSGSGAAGSGGIAGTAGRTGSGGRAGSNAAGGAGATPQPEPGRDAGAEPDPRPRRDASASSPDTSAPPPPASAPGCSVTKEGGGGKDPGGQIPVCCTPPAADKALIDEVFQLLNAHRMANGLSALAYDPKLEAAIQGHCQHMAAHSFFSHTAPEASVAQFTARASACGARASGENIAWNQRTPAAVMNSWKNSSGHNANMLNRNYKRVGIGESKLYWGQIFGN